MEYLARFFEPGTWQESSFTNRQGKTIRYGHATPEGDIKGTVVMTTGYADFIESYFETMHEYLDRGYQVFMMDWAGHGASEKIRAADVKTGDQKKPAILDDHIADLWQFRAQVVKPAEGKPVFLSTHSMGGQVALHMLKDHPDAFDGAVLATPLVDVKVKGLQKAVLAGAFRAAVKLGFGGRVLEGGRQKAVRNITRARRERKKDNPVRMGLHKAFMLGARDLRAEDPTVAYADNIYRATAALNAPGSLESIKTAVLFGIAGRDNMIDNETIRHAVRVMPQARVCDLPEASHAFWIERDDLRRQWWQSIDGFFADCHAAFERKHRPANNNAAADAFAAKPPKSAAKGPRA
jgi:lysophospholipase